MSLEMLQASLYFHPAMEKAEALALVRRAYTGLGPYQGEPLAPAFPEEAAVIERGDMELFEEAGDTFTAKHAGMGRATGSRLWTMEFRFVSDYAPAWAEIQLDPALKEAEPNAIAAVWDFLLFAMPRFVESTSPSLAMANGADEEEELALPSGRRLPADGLPPWFTPWTYLGPDRLDAERREWLRSLPAHHSGPLGEGWLVQAVPDLFHDPDPAFLDALENAPGQRIGYRQASVE
jgi:hypothetical protein